MATMDKKSSHSGPDLTGIHPRYTWEAEGAADPVPPAEARPAVPRGGDLQESLQQLDAELQRLKAALEDVVALALTESDPKQRVIMMQRRAIAALTGLDSRPSPPLSSS
jgi:hypothetical protein